jgi:MYXO-CTERM domain-containing protein
MPARPFSRAAMSLAIACFVAMGPEQSAHAQSVAPAHPRALADVSAARGDSELQSLSALAGDRARVTLDDDGRTLRTLFGAAMAPAGSSFEASALAVLERFGPLFGAPHGATFVVDDVVTAHGFSVAHLSRRMDGRAVVLASFVVRARPDGLVDLVHADAMPAHVIAWPAGAQAADAIPAALSATRYAAPRAISTREVVLALDDAMRPAFEIEVAGAERTEAARVYVDATSGAVLFVEALVLDAMGRVYPNNPTTDRAMPVDLELADLTSRDFLSGRHARIFSCDQSSADCPTIQHAAADVDGNFLFDPMPRAYDDAFAEVSAYHHVTRVVGYMEDTHGFGWSCGGSTAMSVLVNYTETPSTPYDNAAFSPGFRGGCGYLLFGQGATDDFAYDGDVVYHEYGHAVTDAVTDLGFFGTGNAPNYDPLAINEGTSDYWASAVQGNAQIAESITNLEGGRGGALRTIDGDLTCPYDLIGEGHYDGRLWSGLGWASREAIGQELTDAMFFLAISSTTGSASLTDAATNFLATAMSYETMGMITADQRTMVEAAISARGLDACSHVVPLDDGHAHEGYSGSQFVTGSFAHGLAPLEYSLEIPPDITSIEIDVEHATFAGEVTVHFSSGLPVRASASRVTSSVHMAIGRSGTAFLDISDSALVPCQRMYIGVESTDLNTVGESLYSIIGRMNTSGDPLAACPTAAHDAGATEADAGAPDGGTIAPVAGGGCACRAGSGEGHAQSAWVLVGLALLATRRRRPASS